jgi:hypothetical protein
MVLMRFSCLCRSLLEATLVLPEAIQRLEVLLRTHCMTLWGVQLQAQAQTQVFGSPRQDKPRKVDETKKDKSRKKDGKKSRKKDGKKEKNHHKKEGRNPKKRHRKQEKLAQTSHSSSSSSFSSNSDSDCASTSSGEHASGKNSRIAEARPKPAKAEVSGWFDVKFNQLAGFLKAYETAHGTSFDRGKTAYHIATGQELHEPPKGQTARPRKTFTEAINRWQGWSARATALNVDLETLATSELADEVCDGTKFAEWCKGKARG